MVHCPTCRKVFDSLESQSMPFCSDRCRLIDLGNWAAEKYRIPTAQDPEPEEEEEKREDRD
jgi:endogenous inhibitor of DNA gyrase (YacG/DUF329 family)